MSADHPPIHSRLDRLHRITLDVLLGLCFALSFAMSWLGLRMLYDLGGVEQVGSQMAFARISIPFIGAGAVHALIFAALRHWRGSRKSRLFFGAVLPLQLLAVFISYGAHWTHFNGVQATLASYRAALAMTDRAVHRLVQSFDFLERQTSALDTYSQQRADIEAKDGGTCGKDSGDGRGPRYDLRMNDRETFSAFQKDSAARRQQYADLLKRIAGLSATDADAAVRGVAELRRVVDEAKALESDPLPQQIRRVVAARVALGRSDIPIPLNRRGKSGRATFSCFDPVLEQRGQAVIEAVNALKPMPEIGFSDARDPRTGFGLAVSRLFHRGYGALFVRKPPPRSAPDMVVDDLDTSRDLPPLLTASLLESLLVLLFMLRFRLPRHVGSEDIRDALARGGNPVFDDLWSRLAGNSGGLVEAVYNHGKVTPFGCYVFAPVDGARPEANAMHQMMEALAFAGLAKLVYVDPTGFERRWLTRGIRPDRLARLTEAEALLVYKMTRAAFFSLVTDALAREDRAKAAAARTVRPAALAVPPPRLRPV
jgi:hypothetical protein